MVEISVSLRESNKARTRLAISNEATRLFIERGFENVTVAEIADAARVSVKTVFNYFSSKEDLFFDRVDDFRDSLIDAVRDRADGVGTLEALRAVLSDRRVPFDSDGWRSLREPAGYEGFRGFLAAQEASPALRAKRLSLAEDWTASFEELFAAEWSEREAKVLAALVVAVVMLRNREMTAAMLQRASPRTVERRVRAVVDEGFARLAQAFAP